MYTAGSSFATCKHEKYLPSLAPKDPFVKQDSGHGINEKKSTVVLI